MRKLLHSILISAVFVCALLIGHLFFSSAFDAEIIVQQTAEDEDYTEESDIVKQAPAPQKNTQVHAAAEKNNTDSGIISEKNIKSDEINVPRKQVNERAVISEEKTPETVETAETKSEVPQRTVSHRKDDSLSIREPPVAKKYIEPPEKKSAPVVSPEIRKTKTVNVSSPTVKAADEKKDIPEKKKQENIPHWIEHFDPDGHANGVKFVDNWRVDGGVLFTPKTKFYIRMEKGASFNSVLVIESKKSSAVFARDISDEVDLNKTPVMRWRWRVKKLPPKADGRQRKKDDQAVGIYIGTGTALNQKSIAYRWETETPLGHWGRTVYSKVMDVSFRCQRNKSSGIGIWYEESRNVRDDFLKKYGFVPKKIGLVICGNSQNSKSDALAEIDYIGFYKENGKEK